MVLFGKMTWTVCIQSISSGFSKRGEECLLTRDGNGDVPGAGKLVQGFETRKAVLRLGNPLRGDNSTTPRNKAKLNAVQGWADEITPYLSRGARGKTFAVTRDEKKRAAMKPGATIVKGGYGGGNYLDYLTSRTRGLYRVQNRP